MSQPPKVRSFSSARGMNLLIRGERASVRLPSRMVPICVSDPTGCDLPLRTSSTPAMKVVLTAPMPGSSTPSFPLAGAILEGFSMPLLYRTIAMRSTEKMNLEQESPQQKRAASTNKLVMMREDLRICKSARKKHSVTTIEPEARTTNKPSGCCRHSGQSRLDLALTRAASRDKVG